MNGRKILYFTFDDGPNPPCTEEILEILAQNGAEATFFVCGKNALRNPELVRRIAAQGHALGNHSYAHAWRNIFFGRALAREFLKTGEALRQIIGFAPRLLRAPWGKIPKSARRKLERAGYKFFSWDLHAYDWWQPSAQWMARRIVKRAGPGAIILLHDGEKTLVHAKRGRTAEALRICLPELARQGYVFRKLE